IVSRPAPTSASMNAIRSSTLTGVFSFCRPSRGPTSTMRTESLILISRSERLDLGEFDALAHDIPDAAFYRLQHARKRRAQGLLHLHDFKRQDRSSLLQLVPDFSQQRHHGARQRRHDLVLTDLLFALPSERIDPMQIEAAVTRPQIKFMAFNDRNDLGFHAVQGQVKAAVIAWRACGNHFALSDRQRRGTVAVDQPNLSFRTLPVTKPEKPLPPAHGHPARSQPRRTRLLPNDLGFFAEDSRDGCAQLEIA